VIYAAGNDRESTWNPVKSDFYGIPAISCKIKELGIDRRDGFAYNTVVIIL